MPGQNAVLDQEEQPVASPGSKPRRTYLEFSRDPIDLARTIANAKCWDRAREARQTLNHGRKNIAGVLLAVREPGRPYSRGSNPAAYSSRLGRFVHGSVKTVAGHPSRPVSIAARSLWQNSSSCFWRRAIASTLPSSMTRFRFDMMPPPPIRVSVTL